MHTHLTFAAALAVATAACGADDAATDAGPDDGSGDTAEASGVPDTSRPIVDVTPHDAVAPDSEGSDVADSSAARDGSGTAGDADAGTPADVADDSEGSDPAPVDGGCAVYHRPVGQGQLPPGLVELSGLATSRRDPSLLWGHNDSGDTARLFAFRLDGTAVGTIDLGFEPDDWEDMASGPCSADRSGSCLYVGDIGDNGVNRENVTVYRVVEPESFDAVPSYDAMVLTYPDGPHDAEGLFVDAAGRVYILTKAGGESLLYRAVFDSASPVEATLLGALTLSALPGSGSALVTGADYDPVTGRLIVRSYAGIAEWRPGAGTDPSALIGLVGTRLSAGFEVQGEAVAYFGEGYVHAAEGESATIHFAACEP